jgi:hypothetical protein
MIMALPSIAATTEVLAFGDRRIGLAEDWPSSSFLDNSIMPATRSRIQQHRRTIEDLFSRLKIPSKIPSGVALLKLVE